MSRSGFRVKVVSCPPPLEPGHPPAGSKSQLSHPQNSKAKGDCRKFGLFLRTFRRESESLPVCSEWAWYSLSQFGAQQAGPCSYCYLSLVLGTELTALQRSSQAAPPMCTSSPQRSHSRSTSSECVRLHPREAPVLRLDFSDLEEGFTWKNSAIRLSSHCAGLGHSLSAFYPVSPFSTSDP